MIKLRIKKPANRAFLLLSLGCCISDTVMWIILFLHSNIKFNDQYTLLFIFIYLVSWMASMMGLIHIAISKLIAFTAAIAVVLIATAILNCIGFLWLVGHAAF